jgi:hypothetical protein
MNIRGSSITIFLFLLLSLSILSLAHAQNSPPIADAGPNQTAWINEAVPLYGSATDPDNNPIVGWQ